MASRVNSVVEQGTGKYTGQIRDVNVNRLVQAWLGHTPANLDMSFEEFLLMPSRETKEFGVGFATKHREMIKEILITYADSVNIINVMAGVGDTRHHSCLGRDRYNSHVDRDVASGYEYEDQDRLHAQEFEVDDDLAAYIMEMRIQEEVNRGHVPHSTTHQRP